MGAVMWEKMVGRELVLVYPLLGTHVFLSERRKEPWKGKLSGLGGGVKPAEDKSLFDACLREVREESRREIFEKNLQKGGEFEVRQKGLEGSWMLHVFLLRQIGFIPRVTDEMGPHHLYPIMKLPWPDMISGDNQWLQRLLLEEFLRGSMLRDCNGELLEISVEKCVGF